MKCFLLRFGIRQVCWLLSFLFDNSLKVLDRAAGKTNKQGHYTGKEVKPGLLANEYILHIENPKEHIQMIRINTWVQEDYDI